jgi:predicted lipoprotein with Yx(FWY)xxD motif
MRCIGPVICTLLFVVVVASCGTSSPKSNAGAQPVRVDSAYLAQVKGTILVDSSGYPLYVFAPDKQRAVTCTGPCAAVWPPLKSTSSASPVAGPGVEAKLLGLDADPGGGQVVTYNGWPLYRYQVDSEVGAGSAVASGQGLNLNGGYWYVMLASGAPVVRPRSAGS